MNARLISATVASCLLATAGLPALAHGSMEPSHGGVVQMSGETLVELVKTAKGLDVYISEEDEPLPASGFVGSLIVTPAAGDKFTVTLKPVSANRFTAAGVKPSSGTKVVVSLVNKGNSAKTFATFRYK